MTEAKAPLYMTSRTSVFTSRDIPAALVRRLNLTVDRAALNLTRQAETVQWIGNAADLGRCKNDRVGFCSTDD